jgi:CspA family cold shock protein
MAQGTVKWSNKDKGYNIISANDEGEDLFVHYSSIEGGGFKSLDEGARVTFEKIQGRKGPQAESVSKAPAPTFAPTAPGPDRRSRLATPGSIDGR